MKFLASILALCMMAVCLALPLGAFGGNCDIGGRDVVVVRGNSRSRDFNRGRDVVVIDNSRGRSRGRSFSNRSNRGGNRGNNGVRVIVR